jgi:hypothetical protein
VRRIEFWGAQAASLLVLAAGQNKLYSPDFPRLAETIFFFEPAFKIATMVPLLTTNSQTVEPAGHPRIRSGDASVGVFLKAHYPPLHRPNGANGMNTPCWEAGRWTALVDGNPTERIGRSRVNDIEGKVTKVGASERG